jgi:acyl dehydratase
MCGNSDVMQIDYEPPPVVKEITEDLLRNYSFRYPGVFIRTIHVDKEAAASWGFPDLVLQGSQTMNFAAEMLFKAYRKHWINDSSLTVKFIKPVFAGERVTTKGRVKERSEESDGLIRVKIDVWAENHSGEKVMVGEAAIAAPRDGVSMHT